MSTQKAYAVIVAGGSGTRMQSALPKQFLLLNQKPVIFHTINAFAKSSYQPELMIVLPSAYHDHWKELCVNYEFDLPHRLINGGDTRFHSVQNAINLITDVDALVAIHDAVRPLITPLIIDNCYRQADHLGNAVVTVNSRDSVRRVKNNVSESMLRDEIYLVQTPQTFRLAQLKAAYGLEYLSSFTDDASVVEKAGYAIHLAEGSYTNFKITYPEDLAIAEVLLK